ncbi:MAG: IS1634 family transposase [Anaerovoracaceae bacterium]|jgi:transposase
MRVTLSRSKNAEQVYITKAYRNENGKSTSKIFKKLGTMASLLPEHDNDREKVLAWAREQAKIYTAAEKKEQLEVPFELSEGKQLAINEQHVYQGGYLYLQKIYHELGLDEICRSVSKKYRLKYNLSDILSGLIYARVLSPSSKRASHRYLQGLLEKPSYQEQDLYRSLDVLDAESDRIQSLLYEKHGHCRNTSVLYYDCTTYFFEIEQEKGMRKYGKSKEHRPNPIVKMGLFLDGDGFPLAFTVFPGNESEQPSLIPLEKRILKDYDLSKFVICTDAGLASAANRRFNDRENRSFVVTQSLKILKSHLREWALDPEGWSLGDGTETYNLSKIDETIYQDHVFYKERWIHENGFEQRMIVTYSPKYKNYQREIRNRQVERAEKMIDRGKETKNQNSPKRFIEQLSFTVDGEIAEQEKRYLNEEKVKDEERYDGFYAVCTTLEDDASEILKINKRRWEIEESFRIMKNDFKSRPAYVQTDAHIKAHFFTCFLALLVYRTLEKKLDDKYTVSEITKGLKDMMFYKVKGIGYAPCYTRRKFTDDLHKVFDFRTDKQFISNKTMKKIIRQTKN